ncbi:DUF5107-containing protein [Aureococcus anophagefferens]|nr:DUF5107-containing protein [Aureococcus anophagefferens]
MSLFTIMLLSTAAAATVIELGAQQMNMSVVFPPSLLPHFVDTTPKPIADDRLGDSCPDDIWENLINQSYPSLPYRVVDDYTRDGAETTRTGSMPIVTASSASLVATFFPATGGKLASITANNEELLFRNPVYQPANLGRLNAWTSGGVEWNWPRLGHSVFTSQPVFVAEVATARGPLVRVYEFDREMNTTWQVDAFLPPNGTTLWTRVTVNNPNPTPVAGYWWTNVGAKIGERSRVVLPADLAIVSTGDDPARPLEAAPFPFFADAGANASFAPTDHSYPANYGKARENFIRGGGGDHAFMSIHDGRGRGLLHAQSATQAEGRKYWVWGTDDDDAARMRFLSSPGDGDYVELQAGPAPTQSQTFPLGAGARRAWTESFSPLAMEADATKLNGPYAAAVAAVAERLETVGPARAEFDDVDAFLASVADAPPPFSTSEARPFPGAPGLAFGSVDEAVAADPAARPWASLLVNGTFGAEANTADVVTSFMVDDAWVSLMERALASAAHPDDAWLLHLHLGVAAHHRADYAGAMAHYEASAARKRTALAARIAALRAPGAARRRRLLEAWALAAAAASARGDAVASGREPARCPAAVAGPPPRDDATSACEPR